jgi:dihydropteroate synthase
VIWRCRDLAFDPGARPLVMGVLNVTPDSFSDGGRHLEPRAAIASARRMLDEGADLIDVGAESTRPGAAPVPADQQWRRLAPVLEALTGLGAALSVDTTRAEVARRALAVGAHAINDISALGDPEMGPVAAAAGAGVVLMHMRGTPATMQEDPRYQDAVAEIRDWLAERVRAARAAGITLERIAVDPGIGFGKTADHNLALIAGLDAFAALGRPVLVGLSRKRFIGAVLDRDVDGRLEGGLAAAAIAVFQGATIVRTHDVRETVQAVRMAAALRGARPARQTSATEA